METNVTCLRPKVMTLRMLNERNREFWRIQNQLADQRMSDEAVLRVAVNDVCSQTSRGIPVPWQKNFEVALADAEMAKHIFQEEHSRKGGRASRSDALQGLIGQIVLPNRNICQARLLRMLGGEAGVGVVTSIDEESSLLEGDIRSIHFVDYDGRPKKASVYGLKDRLSREKRKIDSL